VTEDPEATQRDASGPALRIPAVVLVAGEGRAVALALGDSFHIGPFSFVVLDAQRAAESTGSGRDVLRVDDPTLGGVPAVVREIAASEARRASWCWARPASARSSCRARSTSCRAGAVRSSRSTAPRSPSRSSKASVSATRRARSSRGLPRRTERRGDRGLPRAASPMDPRRAQTVLALPDHGQSARPHVRCFTSPTWERCGTRAGGSSAGAPAGGDAARFGRSGRASFGLAGGHGHVTKLLEA
jgi:hypothetical protein